VPKVSGIEDDELSKLKIKVFIVLELYFGIFSPLEIEFKEILTSNKFQNQRKLKKQAVTENQFLITFFIAS
jgi:hypothetical protein